MARGNLRKLLHGKSRPAREVFTVNVGLSQYRVVGPHQKQPGVGDTFMAVPARYRNNRIGRRTFLVLDLAILDGVPIYTLVQVPNI